MELRLLQQSSRSTNGPRVNPRGSAGPLHSQPRWLCHLCQEDRGHLQPLFDGKGNDKEKEHGGNFLMGETLLAKVKKASGAELEWGLAW